MNIDKLSESGARQTLTDILKGIQTFADNSEEDDIKTLLHELVDVFDELSQDDFFGTEGWQHYFGMET